MKKCSRCKQVKELSAFGKDRKKKDGMCIYCKECRRWWRLGNKENRKQYQKQYYLDNKDVLGEIHKEYRQNNKEKILQQGKQYRLENKEKKSKYVYAYETKRRHNDPAFRMLKNLRRRVLDALNGNSKAESTKELLGCDINFLLAWLNMTALANGYKNFNSRDYSGKDYHIDHKVPCASFDLSKPEEQKKCFHWTNLQILTAKENLIKSDKF